MPPHAGYCAAQRILGDIFAEWWTKMIRAVYARITVVGTTFIEAQLTPAAYRHGLAVALSEAVQAEWRARPVLDAR